MDLDNEENYFTKRMNGAIKNEDIEKAVEKILDIKKEYSTMDGLKEYVYAIETILNELKYKKQLLRRVCKECNQEGLKNEKLQKELEKKDKIIDLMARSIDNYDSQLEINYFKNKEHIIEVFNKKAEE